MTQSENIRDHLESGESITPIEALNLFGCFRLAARIGELRGNGINIETVIVSDPKTGKHYARYAISL